MLKLAALRRSTTMLYRKHLTADANTTVLWSMHKLNVGHDSSGNGFDGTTPASSTTLDSADAGEL